MAVKPIPDGYPVVAPYLAVEGAERVLRFAKDVFGATERLVMPGPEGKVAHAEITIGDSLVMLGDASLSDEPAPPMPAMLHVYVEDVDKSYQRALEAGATSVREPMDQFYGDRVAAVRDAGGNVWYMATHVEDVSPEEMARRTQQQG